MNGSDGARSRTGQRPRHEAGAGVPVAAWEIMRRIKTAIGMGEMVRVLAVGRTQVDRYCRNPDFTADSERCPLRRLRDLFVVAVDAGATDEVRAAVNLLAEVFGCRVMPVDAPEPDAPTVEAECLDDYPTLVRLHEAMRQGAALATVRTLAEDHARECAQTVERYAREKAGEA